MSSPAKRAASRSSATAPRTTSWSSIPSPRPTATCSTTTAPTATAQFNAAIVHIGEGCPFRFVTGSKKTNDKIVTNGNQYGTFTGTGTLGISSTFSNIALNDWLYHRPDAAFAGTLESVGSATAYEMKPGTKRGDARPLQVQFHGQVVEDELAFR